MNNTETFILEGPVSYYYYEKENIKILLFGDIHIPFKKCNNLNILTFFENLIFLNKNKKGCMDFFLEDAINVDINNKIIPSPPAYNNGKMIHKIRENMKKRKILAKEYGLRIHYIDLGQVRVGNNKLIKDDILLNPSLLKSNIILKFFNSKKNILHKLLFGICIYIFDECSIHTEEYLLGKEYHSLLKENDSEQNRVIRKKFKKQIDALGDIFTKKDLYEFISNRIKSIIPEGLKELDLKELEQLLTYIRIFLIDAYTICRMFRKFTGGAGVKNIVYYAGAGHTYNISQFFKKINFTCKHSYDTSDGGFTKKWASNVKTCIPMRKGAYFDNNIDDLLNSNFYLKKECSINTSMNDENYKNYDFYNGILKDDVITTKKTDKVTFDDVKEKNIPINVCKSILKL